VLGLGFYFLKVLSQLVFPLCGSLVLAIMAGLLLFLGRRRLGGGLLAVALGWLWLWSTPVFTDAVQASLENRFPPVRVEALESADAIVVLGGAMEGAAPPRLYPDLSAAADRVWHAARIYHAGKAPLLVLSGGEFFRADLDMDAESVVMGEFLEDLGVPREAMLHEAESRNTYENAVHTRAILEEHGIERVLLVTSALHMPRAKRIFEAQGIALIPAATDYEVVEESWNLLNWLPSSRALEGGTRAFKEYLGMIGFALRGR